MRIAITRGVSPAVAECELTHLERRPIDYRRATAQHRAYEAALRELGCEVRALPAETRLPDSVFVEDIAVVLDEPQGGSYYGGAVAAPVVGKILQRGLVYAK